MESIRKYTEGKVISAVAVAVLVLFMGIMLNSVVSHNSASAAAETRIAIIHGRWAMANSAAYKDVISQIQKKQEASGEAIQKIDSKLKKKYQELETQKKVLTQSALDKKKEELAKETEALQKLTREEGAILEMAYSESMSQLNDKVLEIVKAQSEKDGYDMVIDSSVTLYAKESLDITKKAVSQLDKELPTINIDFKKIEQTLKKSNTTSPSHPHQQSENRHQSEGGATK